MKKILKDPQVLQMLMHQLETLADNIYEVNVAFQKIFIVIYPDRYQHSLEDN
jgi:hypothetical protein